MDSGSGRGTLVSVECGGRVILIYCGGRVIVIYCGGRVIVIYCGGRVIALYDSAVIQDQLFRDYIRQLSVCLQVNHIVLISSPFKFCKSDCCSRIGDAASSSTWIIYKLMNHIQINSSNSV